MTKLKVLSKYANGSLNVSYAAGDEIEVSPQMAQYLKVDAPGCFEDVKTEVKQSKPRRNKAVKRPKVNK